MLNFIICDDSVSMSDRICKIVTKLMLPTDIEYKTIIFAKYDKAFSQVIERKIGRKIYILDIEVDGCSGLDIARKIREKDWESVIIILTAHYELAYDAFKNRLMLLDFISKFDDYQRNLYDVLKIALKVSNVKRQLTFKFNRVSYKIDLDEILYIMKDTSNRNTIIKTFSKEYQTSLSLNKISGMLSDDFIKTHRACIVNRANVKTIDFKDNIIIFNNSEQIKLLSKNYKKEVKKYVFN